MSLSPASGERNALRGYMWQYDHISKLVYDALVDDAFVSLRLTDPEAGRVDDLVLITRRRADGYQFKSANPPGSLTLNRLLASGRTPTGMPTPSLCRSLADGWDRLRVRHAEVRVHLVTQDRASTSDHLAGDGQPRPSPDHFFAFLRQVLGPVGSGSLELSDVPLAWRSALERVRTESGLPDERSAAFLRRLIVETNTPSALPESPSTRRSDIIALSDALCRLVAGAEDVVVLNRNQVLELVDWTDRPRLRSRHDFPVDLDTYEPLKEPIAEVDSWLARLDSGYVALVGPPGSGKSTLLSQSLSGRPDRVVRYYAFVPGLAPLRTRMTARSFLQDTVIMLSESGLRTGERQLPSADVDSLRQQLTDLFDAASVEFCRTGRRTIVVVDGLDHVERDHPGADALLAELPRPGELPTGVVIVIGSRTLSPLNPYARAYVEEHGTVVDLGNHRLPHSAVVDICRRSPVTSDFGHQVHARIAALCDGHPLALSLLINRLRESNGHTAMTVLDDAPAYSGDIAGEYQAMWDVIEDNFAVTDILAVCARLRVGFDLDWIIRWASPDAMRTFRKRLLYLFREHHDGWRFFHDSFRQFASDRTAVGISGQHDQASDQEVHRRAADLCATAPLSSLRDEELYHRWCSGDDDAVLQLAQPETFRAQSASFRAGDLIRSDIAVALQTAAIRGDIISVLRLVLSLAESRTRSEALDDVNMPAVLYDAGMVDEAIGYCGVSSRRVSLAQAYALAGALGRAGDPAGRRIFDLVEHDGLMDGEQRVGGAEDGTAREWGRAAPFFRPIEKVLATVAHALADAGAGDETDARGHGNAPFSAMMTSVIDTVAEIHDDAALQRVDDMLSAIAARILTNSDTDDAKSDLATLIDLRVRIFHARRERGAAASVDDEVGRLREELRGRPIYLETAMGIAQVFVEHGRFDDAAYFLEWPGIDHALTVTGLGYLGDPGVVQTAFRYWRLRYSLARHNGDTAFVAVSVPPDPATPAGDGADPDAFVHRDTDAIDLAARIDHAVLTLAQLDEASTAGEPVGLYEAWSALLPILEIFRPRARVHSSGSASGLARQKEPIMQLLADVAINHSASLATRLANAFGQRFASHPDHWPPDLRLRLAQRLRNGGIAVTWLADALAAQEGILNKQDVRTRLEGTAALVHHHATLGNRAEARRLAMSLIPMAFGVGFRKDYQFDQWVEWLGRALVEPGGSVLLADAAWLAKLLDAANPMTEGEPGIAAAELPAVVSAASPAAAVRIFSHLVRHGTVDHVQALAALVTGLITQVGHDDANALRLAMDLTTEIIAPAARVAFPALGEALARATERVYGAASATGIVADVVDRLDLVALATTRSTWSRELEQREPDVPYQANGASEYGSLVLTDGRRYPRNQVSGLIRSFDDIVILRQEEAENSSFSWMRLLDGRIFTRAELGVLADLFGDGSRSGAEALAVLAEAAEVSGEIDIASRLAEDAILRTQPESWSAHWSGGARRRASAVAIRTSGHDGLVAVCRDLADQAIEIDYFASLVVNDLADILNAIAPGMSPSATWPEVRRYLEGIAATLSLPDDDPLEHYGTSWWHLPATPRPRLSLAQDAAAALAELAVLHLSHPAWVSRDGAVITLARALQRGDKAVANVMAELASHDSTDDIVEYAGRVLAAARALGTSTPPSLNHLNTTLSTHGNQAVRNLAEHSSARYRPLAGRYSLMLPSPQRLIGQPTRMLSPHEGQYAAMARHTGLAIETLRNVADAYAREQLDRLPTDVEMQDALRAAGFGHYFPYAQVWASRAAFGRVLADLLDAGHLDNAPADLIRMLKTTDIELLNARPGRRPNAIPPAPEAGHDQTLQRWLQEAEMRADEYAAAADGGRTVLGATGVLSVLNWGHLREEFSCGTIVGDRVDGEETLLCAQSVLMADLAQPTSAWYPELGEPLVVSHAGDTFLQWPAADWLSFRPDVASALDWTPDMDHPGLWKTANGQVAVESVWWVDGWWSHTSRAFDDTTAQGHAVLLSAAGTRELLTVVGPLAWRLSLTRSGREDGQDATPVTVVRRSTLRLPVND